MKTVLISGTSSGFGRLAASLLAQSGYRVYAGMRNINGANAAVAQELAAEPNITVEQLVQKRIGVRR